MKCPGSGQLTVALADPGNGWQLCPACNQRVPIIREPRAHPPINGCTVAGMHPCQISAAAPRLMTHNTNHRATRPAVDAPAFGL